MRRADVLRVGVAATAAFLAALLPVRIEAQEDRPVPGWLVVGAWPAAPGAEGLASDHLADEGRIAPHGGDAAEGRVWRPASADSLGRVDLKVAVGSPPLEHAVAYAFAWVISPEDRTVTFAFESDDDVRVRLNGVVILEREVARSVRGGTDTVTVRLAAGANRLLMKVVNRTGGFGLGARLLALSEDPVADLVLATARPEGVRRATAPAPALTLGPPAVAAAARLDAGVGVLAVPVVVHVARWGGLDAPVRVRLGAAEADVSPAPEGRSGEVTLTTSWDDLARAAAAGAPGVVATTSDGRRYGRRLEPGPILRVLARPVTVDGWRWRGEGDTSWRDVPPATAHGVDRAVVREARALRFETRVPESLAGLTLHLDPGEFGAEARYLVNGKRRTLDRGGLVELCGPCLAGGPLSVEVRPGGARWWNPPRLVIADPGWYEIAEGARWARFFLGPDSAPPTPGPGVARELLAARVGGDAARYRAVVEEWMARLAPAARRIRKDTIDLVGNAHIDAAWLWRWPETVDVVRNTWRTAVKLMKRYPEMTFAGSAARYYTWLETYEPELLDDIRRLRAQHRWAAVGGWWVEADANLPSGESLVRQALYGQRTYRRLFGTFARVAWIPDTFGYTWTLPQIFRKSGLEWFVTQKLRWNDTDKWSADRNLFWWQGRDGTRILTYIPYGYVHQLKAESLATEWAATRDSTAVRRMLVLYGVGDHGGGPTMEMLDRRRALARIPTFPVLRGTLPAEALARMEGRAPAATPVIDDELYLEYHRGVYTTQAAMKRWNRKMEGLLGAAEAAATHAVAVAPADAWYNYPRGALTETWTRTLFNQFHDILPGSGIGPVYDDARADYREAERLARMTLERAAGVMTATLDTRPPRAGGRPYAVINPSGRARGGTVVLPFDGPPPAAVVDAGDDALPYAIRDGALRIRVREVPPTGVSLVFVADGTQDSGAQAPEAARGRRRKDAASAGRRILENALLRVEIDAATGEIARILDRVHGREVLQPAGGGNRLATEPDRPKEWDAWNIDGVEGPWTPVADTVEVGPVRRDGLGVWVETVRADAHGRFVQRYALQDGSRRLDVDTRAIWRADHRLLKASFPLAVGADSVWAEIPYGAMARPARPRTRADSARYEVSAHRWIDASAGGWGVALVNDGKYGYDVRGDTMRLTLLKAPTWPDPHADRGGQRFRYAVVVHDGDWRDGAVGAAARELNEPLRIVGVPAHEGEGRARAFISVDAPDVRLGALKVAEDGDAFVVRLVEIHGRRAHVRLRAPWAFAWRDADLLERGRGPWVGGSASSADVTMAPWEIRTLLLRRD